MKNRNSMVSDGLIRLADRMLQDGWLTLAILLMAVVCVAALAYHPVYFGDELYSFQSARNADGQLFATLVEMNKYKPRVLMNVAWAVIATEQWPRWMPMLAFAISLGLAAWLVHRMALALGAGRFNALLAAFLVLFSRYDAMLYFDYVSATVETMSLVLFLAGLHALLFSSRTDAGRFKPGSMRMGFVLACFAATVLVHERYIAAFACISVVIACLALRDSKSDVGPRRFIAAGALVLLPLLIYVVLVKSLSITSLTTGTGNMEVKPGLATLIVAAKYASNLMLGSNFGPDWFMGTLNQGHPWHRAVWLISGTIFLLAWVIPWIVRKRRLVSTDQPDIVCVLLASMAGLILVASLPGADRQEARWMLPVFAQCVLLIVALYRRRAATVLLLLLACSQIFYFAYGGLGSMSSIRVSRMAGALGQALEAVNLPGRAGMMLASPEPDTTWMLGVDGKVFCEVNLPADNCIYPRKAGAEQAPGRVGFGLVYTGTSLTAAPSYRYVASDQLAVALNPAQAAGGRVLGDQAEWSGWVLSGKAVIQADGLRVLGLSDNFLRMDAADLDGAMLIYRAHAAGGPTQMRLQVNWHDAADAFLGAQLEVVEVGLQPGTFSTMLTVPEKAAYGNVYASLHDAAPNPVVIGSIRLVASQ